MQRSHHTTVKYDRMKGGSCAELRNCGSSMQNLKTHISQITVHYTQ